tara:strand:- start:12175 stop:13227 length:1053 start_codon:yes stop_codon:yes gene_type:complete
MASIVTGDRSNGFEVLQDRIKLQTGNVLPTNSAPGQLFYKLDEQRVYIRNSSGTNWEILTGGTEQATTTRSTIPQTVSTVQTTNGGITESSPGNYTFFPDSVTQEGSNIPNNLLTSNSNVGLSTNSTIGIVDVIVIKSGKGYLSRPDGSIGGDGRTWATAQDTTVQHENGIYEIPIPPGNIVNTLPGDIVTIPNGSRIVIEPTGEEILGGKKNIIKEAGSFTSPPLDNNAIIRGDYPSSGQGSYPVILYLCDIPIIDSGIGYTDGDEIVIEPNLGAKAIPTFDKFGRLLSIKVTQGGEGFTSRPKIYIRSETGINAKLIPKFCIDRLSDEEVREVGFEKVIQVVDCVGKV